MSDASLVTIHNEGLGYVDPYEDDIKAEIDVLENPPKRVRRERKTIYKWTKGYPKQNLLERGTCILGEEPLRETLPKRDFPIKSKEFAILKTQWAGLREWEELGVTFYKTMFKKMPEVKYMFDKYDQVGLSRFKNPIFINGFTPRIVRFMDVTISKIEEDPDVVNHILWDLGKQHYYRNVGSNLLSSFPHLFIGALRRNPLGLDLNTELWVKFLTHVVLIMDDAMKLEQQLDLLKQEALEKSLERTVSKGDIPKSGKSWGSSLSEFGCSEGEL